MPKTGVNNKLLKQKNRGLLLKLIATGACSSRIELAQKTGLSKMTVSNIVNEFLENDMLEELEKAEKMEGKGRNPIQLRISPRAPKLIGVHLHREGCNVILCDLKLNIQKSFSFPVTSANAENLMEQSAGEKITAGSKVADVYDNTTMTLEVPFNASDVKKSWIGNRHSLLK